MRKHFGIALVGLMLLGAGCAASQISPQGIGNTNVPPVVDETAAGPGLNEIISWKQAKLGFLIRLPETWRVSEVDAGGVSLIRIIAPEGSEKNPAAEIFVQLSKDMEGNAVSSFEQWIGNGGRVNERLISKSVAGGSIVVDGVTLQKRIEDDSTIAYYAQLETNNGVYFRCAYASKHPLKSDLESIIRQMRFSLSADEFGRARVIP
ncbi:hypothetical protein EPO33_05165 [Patescibacteria group bacterium]|nr:MAG: hypothetical protein EPO33_05165 [Patescibacteria group bacterium]